MKWVALVIVLACIAPLVAKLRRSHDATLKVLMLIGFLPWVLSSFHLLMAIISWVDWPGYVKGAEFSVLDALALAVYLSLPRTRHPPPFRIAMALYFVAALLSVLQARVPMPALFYCWQLVRIYLVYATINRACAADPRAAHALLKGMVAGLFVQAGYAIWERFGLGILQTGGTEGHQNLLGVMSHFVVFPFFALLLAGERGWLPAAATLAGMVVQVLTTSRATLGLAGFGYSVIFLLSSMRKWTSRKGMVLLIGVGAVAAVTPVIMSSFEHRFAIQDFGDYDERAAFEKAAAMILSDYPLGVGANQYADITITKGYSARAGVAPTVGSMTAQVHNVYWLVVTETGYLGLVSFVILLFRPLTVAFLCGWRHKGDRTGDLLIGLGMALLIVYIHSFFEWLLISSQTQYMFALEAGMITGLAQHLGYWQQSPHRRRRPLPAGGPA